MKLVLFDLDGTLYTPREILPEAYAEGVRQFNQRHEAPVTVPGESEIFSQVGNPVETTYRNLFPDVSGGERQDLRRLIFSSLLEKIENGEGALFEGVKEVLETLRKDSTLAIVTNAQTRYMNSVVETHDLQPYFRSWLCNDDAPSGKKSELVKVHLERFKVPPEDAVLVGDRESDRRAAATHNVWFVGTRYGYGNASFPTSVETIESITDLPNKISDLRPRRTV